MKHQKNILKFGAFLGLSVLAVSCARNPNDPGIQYAPEMYESIPYEPYKQVKDSITPFANGQTMQAPPEGTVSRGGYAEFEFGPGDSVKASNPDLIALQNPIELNEKTLAEGKVLYTRFCAVCHGAKGKGDGSVAKHSAINPVPYDGDKLKGYTAGQIYHTIMYGQGVMGSYASQIQYEDRWKVVHFVQTLQGKPVIAAAAPSFHVADIDYNTMAVGSRYQLTEVYFNSGDSTLRKDSKALLDELAGFLNAHPSLKLEIGGHTDTDGDAAANAALSDARSKSVVAYLVESGISAERLSSKGYGSSMPIAPNDTPANKQLNRRTELKVNEK